MRLATEKKIESETSTELKERLDEKTTALLKKLSFEHNIPPTVTIEIDKLSKEELEFLLSYIQDDTLFEKTNQKKPIGSKSYGIKLKCDSNALKENLERIIYFITSIKNPSATRLDLSGILFGKLKEGYIVFLKRIIPENYSGNFQEISLSSTALEYLPNSDQMDILNHLWFLTKIQTIYFYNSTLWHMELKDLSEYLGILIKADQPLKNLFLWDDGVAHFNTKDMDEEKRQNFFRICLKTQAMNNSTCSNQMALFNCTDLSEDKWFDLLTEYLSYHRNPWKIITWLKEIPLKEDLRFKLAKQHIMILSQSKGNTPFRIPLIDFKLSPEKHMLLKTDIKTIIEKLSSDCYTIFELDSLNWDADSLTQILKVFQDSILENLSTLRIDLSKVRQEEIPFIIEFINRFEIRSKKPFNGWLQIYLSPVEDKKQLKEILVSFINSLNPKTQLSLDFFAFKILDFQTYSDLLKEIGNKHPNFGFRLLNLSDSLEDFSIDEQKTLILNLLKMNKLKSLKSNNALWTLEPGPLNLFLDEVDNYKGDSITLWSDYNDIIRHPLAKCWDEARKIQFLKTFFRAQKYNNDYASLEPPFACSATEEQLFELYLDYVSYGTRVDRIEPFLKNTKLDEEKRFLLVKKVIEVGGNLSKEMVKAARLSPEKRLELYLFSDLLDNDDDSEPLDLFETHLPASKILSLFKVFSDENRFENEESTSDTIFSIIEGLNNTFKSLWPKCHFYESVLKITITKIEVNFGNLENLDRIIKLILFLANAGVRLTLIPTDIVEKNDILLGTLLKEIYDFPNRVIQARLWATMVNRIANRKDNEGLKILNSIILEQRNWTILTTIPLCSIVLDADEKELKEDLERVNQIIKRLSKNYKAGHYLKTLISTLQLLADSKEIEPNDKLSMIENIVGKTNKSTKHGHKNEIRSGDKKSHSEQISQWLSIQGLAGLSELHKTKESSIDTIVASLFNLDKEEMERYRSEISKLRNPGALLTYLSKIRSQTQNIKFKLEKLFKKFIKTILSADIHAFYKHRYTLAGNAHLEAVFEERKRLHELWKQNNEQALEHFIKTNGIKTKPKKINLEKFIFSRIFEHGHLGKLDCKALKAYIQEKDVKRRKEQKEAIQQQLAGVPKESEDLMYLLKLQIHLINLIESDINSPLADHKDVGEAKALSEQERQVKKRQIQLKEITLASKALDKIPGQFELTSDIGMLWKNLVKIEASLKEDLKGWKIVETDHFWDLFMCGTDVAGSCQRVDGDPSLNRCLLAYVVDGKNRLIAIKDPSGKIAARAIFRILLDAETQNPVLFLEEIYPTTTPSVFYQAIFQFAHLRATQLQLPLVSKDGDQEEIIYYPNPVQSIASPAPVEYVDAIHSKADNGVFTIEKPVVSYLPIYSKICSVFTFMNEKDKPLINLITEYASPTKKEHEEHLRIKS